MVRYSSAKALTAVRIRSQPPNKINKIVNKKNMGFLSNVLSATVKTVLSPVAIAKDVVNVLSNEEVDATKNLISSAVDDIEEGFDDLADGDF